MSLPTRQSLSRFPALSAIILSACLIVLCPRPAHAQFGTVGGVFIDSNGTLKESGALAPDARLKLAREQAAVRSATEDFHAASKLRKVSLRRLEHAVRKLHAEGKPLPAEMRYLAGVNRVEYLFFYPGSEDVVLAGPAENYKPLPSGEVVGVETNRPVLHLDDLVVALRYAFAEKTDAFIGCSIDPMPEGLERYTASMRRLRGRIDRARARQTFAGLERAMGPQEVRLYGVEGSSRFALALVAADYRLKRIALGHDPSPVPQVMSYLDLAARRFAPGAQPQHRWWFLAHYDAVRHTPDELAFRLEGQGVQVATGPAPRRGSDAKERSANAAPAARKFADDFTRHFPAIAAKVPVFAELQNLVGLAVAAELVAQKHFDQTPAIADRSWSPGHFLDAKECPIGKSPVPRRVPSIASYRLVGRRHWLITVSGGVEIDPRELAGPRFRKEAPDGKLASLRGEAEVRPQPEPWWWD